MRTIADVVATVETWQQLRTNVETFTPADMNRFAERMNAQTRLLVSYFERQDPDFWSALAELAVNAGTQVTKNARLIVDGKDMTNR